MCLIIKPQLTATEGATDLPNSQSCRCLLAVVCKCVPRIAITNLSQPSRSTIRHLKHQGLTSSQKVPPSPSRPLHPNHATPSGIIMPSLARGNKHTHTHRHNFTFTSLLQSYSPRAGGVTNQQQSLPHFLSGWAKQKESKLFICHELKRSSSLSIKSRNSGSELPETPLWRTLPSKAPGHLHIEGHLAALRLARPPGVRGLGRRTKTCDAQGLKHLDVPQKHVGLTGGQRKPSMFSANLRKHPTDAWRIELMGLRRRLS